MSLGETIKTLQQELRTAYKEVGQEDHRKVERIITDELDSLAVALARKRIAEACGFDVASYLVAPPIEIDEDEG